MKRCRECDTVVSQASETRFAECRFCGGIDFIDTSEEELQKVLKQLTRRERCCPHSKCPPLLLTGEDKFCSKCGFASELSTLDLWINKCVAPFHEKHPAQLFSNLPSFIESARKMGFSSDKALVKLNEKFQQWTGQSHDVVAGWVSRVENMADLFSLDNLAGMNASKRLYKNIRADEAVVGVVLKLVKNPALKKINVESEINFIEHIQGEYIGFYHKSNNRQLWVFPIANLEFSENIFGTIFYNLTAEDYKSGNIEPRRAFSVNSNNSRIWVSALFIGNRERLVNYLIAAAEKKGINIDFAQQVLESFPQFKTLK